MHLWSSTLATTLTLAFLIPPAEAGAGDKPSKIERDVREALKEAAALGEQAKTLTGDRCRWQVALVKATEAVKRAEILLAHAPGADPALKQQVKKLAGALHQQEKDRQLLERLEEIRLRQSSDNGGQTRARYAQALREHGLAVEEVEASKAAERIRQQPGPIRDSVLAALDHWALLLDGKQQEQQRLRDVLKAADPDPWRNRLREALVNRDAAALKQLAADSNQGQQPPAILSLLAAGLVRVGATAEAVTLLRQAQQRHPADFWLNHSLGLHLMQLQPPRWNETVRFLTAALALRPQEPTAHLNLGHALLEAGQREEAIAALRQAIRLRPDLPLAYLRLGRALIQGGQLDETIAAIRQAIRLEPSNANAHHRLGQALFAQRKYAEAIAAFREAIRLRPDHDAAFNDLGIALRATGRPDEAIACLRAAIALQPASARYYHNLGTALASKGALDEALAAYRKAIALDPTDARGYLSLGKVLRTTGRLDEALAVLRKAIQINPGLDGVHTELGHALADRGDLEEAVAAYRRALESDSPRRIEAPFGLGKVLARMGRLEQAVVSLEQVLAVRPDWAEANWELGHALKRQGRFDEALAALKRSHEKRTGQPPWRDRLAAAVKEVERLRELDARLPAVLKGKAKPAGSAERIVYARLCLYKRLTAASSQFYADAFRAEPKLAEDLRLGNRYAAARAAALTGTGQGKDAGQLDGAEGAAFRQQALGWLQADLAAYRKQLTVGKANDRQQARERLTLWRIDPNLARVRDEAALGKLPPAEREAWGKLWAEVSALWKQAQAR